MCRKYGIEEQIRAEELWLRLSRGPVSSALRSVLFPESEARRMCVGPRLDSGEMGARPPLADSVRG